MSIRITDLTKRFGNAVLFDRLNLDIPLDKPAVIAGRSGCGKTTLLRILAGLDRDYEGSIEGIPERISFMFQEDRLLPWQSVRGNIEFVLKDVMDKAGMDEAVSRMIEAVQLSGHEEKRPAELSGGMKRRVALARTFCYPAELLLLDEPFKGFDEQLNDEMIALFEKLYVQTGKKVVLVTHDLSITDKFDCRVVRLDEAKEA
jgi:NitT/TauT family transport system ATP-binding protein